MTQGTDVSLSLWLPGHLQRARQRVARGVAPDSSAVVLAAAGARTHRSLCEPCSVSRPDSDHLCVLRASGPAGTLRYDMACCRRFNVHLPVCGERQHWQFKMLGESEKNLQMLGGTMPLGV